MKTSCADIVGMALQSLDARLGLVVPDLDQLVIGTTDQEWLVTCRECRVLWSTETDKLVLVVPLICALKCKSRLL